MNLDGIDPCYCERQVSPDDRPTNEAGQDSLEYRFSKHSGAKRRMLQLLSTVSFNVQVIKDDVVDVEPGPNVLADLTTREDTDPTIAMIDAWAVACDVLSFYDERIANEGFLRTATERRSVLELSREIGYELNPGASATAYLAFTVDDGPLSPGELTVPKGLPVQHVPQKEELPQTFETSEEIYIKATWNELRPETEKMQVLVKGHDYPLIIDGPLPEVKPGDYLVLQPDDSAAAPEVRQVTAASFDPVEGTTTLTISTVEASDGNGNGNGNGDGNGNDDGNDKEVNDLGFFGFLFKSPYSEKWVQSYSKYVGKSLFELEKASTGFVRKSVTRDEPDPPKPPIDGATALNPGVYGFNYRTANYGHNAPPWASLPLVMRIGTPDDYADAAKAAVSLSVTNLTAGLHHHERSAVYETMFRAGKDAAAGPFPDSYEESSIHTGYDKPWPDDAEVFLERVFSDLQPGEPLLIQATGDTPDLWQIQEVVEASVAEYTLSGKATGLKLLPPGLPETDPPRYTLRETSIFAGAFALKLSTLPIDTDLEEGAVSITLSSAVTGLTAGRYVLLTGELAEWPGVVRSELLELEEPQHKGGRTTLHFKTGLKNTYTRTSVTINANVVPATHGETVQGEVLGSGDASAPFVRFALKKPPLTYVPASTPTGAESTMDVYVNDVRWEPTDNWYVLGPRDRTYRTTIDDDGKTWVGFGDGKRGARTPTGELNIIANYRSGTGSGGRVAAETLSLLKKKPLGVKSVTNTLDAEGGVDPESRDDARTNAPKTVLTMGYVVSAADLENFARAFAGIGKALATEVVVGSLPTILLTLASSAGTKFETETTTDAFEESVRKFGEPSVRFTVTSYHAREFEVECSLTLDPAYIEEKVVAAVETALLAAFSFSERTFGQNVTSAEVVAVIQNVDGVLMVDLEPLKVMELPVNDDGTANEYEDTASVVELTIVAQKAGWNAADRSIQEPALVTINPFAIKVEVDS